MDSIFLKRIVLFSRRKNLSKVSYEGCNAVYRSGFQDKYDVKWELGGFRHNINMIVGRLKFILR